MSFLFSLYLYPQCPPPVIKTKKRVRVSNHSQMPLNCSTHGFRLPHLLPQTNNIASSTYVGSCFPAHRTKTHPHNFHIVPHLKSNQNFPSSSSVMEEQRELVVSPAQGQEAYAKELDIAIRAVQMASSLSLNLQRTSLHSKHDNSLLTLPGTSITFFSLLTLHIWWLNVTQNVDTSSTSNKN